METELPTDYSMAMITQDHESAHQRLETAWTVRSIDQSYHAIPIPKELLNRMHSHRSTATTTATAPRPTPNPAANVIFNMTCAATAGRTTTIIDEPRHSSRAAAATTCTSHSHSHRHDHRHDHRLRSASQTPAPPPQPPSPLATPEHDHHDHNHHQQQKVCQNAVEQWCT